MALSTYDFAKLFLAKLAENSISTNKSPCAFIPFNYRERIKNILYADNCWKERFSSLIDMEKYFDDHFFWEENFAKDLLKVLKDLKKEFKFDIVNEYMTVNFSKKEIHEILSSYDENTIQLANHFVSLALDVIYSREFQENYYSFAFGS